jgi:hypothetical protein
MAQNLARRSGGLFEATHPRATDLRRKGTMAYARINPIVWWWRRRCLLADVRNSMVTKSRESRKNVLNSLATCPLFVAVRQLPRLPTDKGGRLAEDVSVTVLTSDGPQGEVLFVFTSNAELRKRSAEAASLVTDLSGVVAMLPANAAGVVLNPEGDCLFISREELRATPRAQLTGRID